MVSVTPLSETAPPMPSALSPLEAAPPETALAEKLVTSIEPVELIRKRAPPC